MFQITDTMNTYNRAIYMIYTKQYKQLFTNHYQSGIN